MFIEEGISRVHFCTDTAAAESEAQAGTGNHVRFLWVCVLVKQWHARIHLPHVDSLHPMNKTSTSSAMFSECYFKAKTRHIPDTLILQTPSCFTKQTYFTVLHRVLKKLSNEFIRCCRLTHTFSRDENILFSYVWYVASEVLRSFICLTLHIATVVVFTVFPGKMQEKEMWCGDALACTTWPCLHHCSWVTHRISSGNATWLTSVVHLLKIKSPYGTFHNTDVSTPTLTTSRKLRSTSTVVLPNLWIP